VVEEEEVDEDDLDDAVEEDATDIPLKTLFELNDTLYAEAEIEETGEIGLWLGVSVTRQLRADLIGEYHALISITGSYRFTRVKVIGSQEEFGRDYRRFRMAKGASDRDGGQLCTGS
jgi:hypothetical protein